MVGGGAIIFKTKFPSSRYLIGQPAPRVVSKKFNALVKNLLSLFVEISKRKAVRLFWKNKQDLFPRNFKTSRSTYIEYFKNNLKKLICIEYSEKMLRKVLKAVGNCYSNICHVNFKYT